MGLAKYADPLPQNLHSLILRYVHPFTRLHLYKFRPHVHHRQSEKIHRIVQFQLMAKYVLIIII